MKKLAWVLVGALLAGPASANITNLSVGVAGNIVTVAWTGTVLSGSDNGGFFGPAGADLTGDPFSLSTCLTFL